MPAVEESRSIAYSADTTGRDGRITCQVIRNHMVDAGRVNYTILVRNDTAGDAVALALIDDALDFRQRKLVQSVVGPYSSFSTFVELEVARYGGIPEFALEVSGEDIDFTLIAPKLGVTALAAIGAGGATNGEAQTHQPALPEAALFGRQRSIGPQEPSAPRPRPASVVADTRAAVAIEPSRAPAVFPAFVIFAAIIVIAGLAISRPQISELGVPARAQAEQSVLLRYCATGIGSVSYRVVGPSGDPIANGPLSTGCGTWPVTLPKTDAERAYLIEVTVSGLFGNAAAERYIRVPAPVTHASVSVKEPRKAPPRPLDPPQIRSLAVDRGTVTGGDKLNVYYDVAAAGGNIALVDAASQISYGKSALSASGHTEFVVPAVDTQRFFSVVLTAGRGAATTQSRVAITAAPQASPSPSPGDAANASPGDGPAGGAPLIVAPQTVRARQAIHIDVRNNSAGLVLTLSDPAGVQLARRELAATQTSATFAAPAVTRTQRIRLEATYAQGPGSETIVQTIVVVPR